MLPPPLPIYQVFLVLFAGIPLLNAVTLVADFSQNGFKGSLEIDQAVPDGVISLRFFLRGKADAQQYGWKILNTPKDLSVDQDCKSIHPDVYIDLEAFFGKVTVPGEKSMNITKNIDWRFDLFGNDTLWGKSVVIGEEICGNFRVKSGEESQIASARFSHPVAGIVWFRSVVIGDKTHTVVYTDLYDSKNNPPQSSDHEWQLYVTDILDQGGSFKDCNHLQTSFGPDLADQVGKVRVASAPDAFSRRQRTLEDFEFPELSGGRNVYLVIRDADHPDSFYACAKLNREFPREAIVVFSANGVIGNASLEQRDPFSFTRLRFDLDGLNNKSGGYHVHDYPLKFGDSCGDTGGHYNPTKVQINPTLGAGIGTHDQYELGDLSGKHGLYRGLAYVKGSTWDHHLPLWGPHSVQGRSLVIHEDATGKRWVCSNIVAKEEKFVVATATFRYPIVGRIWFWQREGQPNSETTIFIERLLYSDGSVNNTYDHSWGIYSKKPGKDYYDWQNRCRSAGKVFDPFKRSEEEANGCSTSSPLRCKVGDLSARHGTLSIMYTKKGIAKTRKFFTDTALPLQGPQSIIGRSMVIQDFKGPKARGDRLACTPIVRWHRQKAVANDWFVNHGETEIEGALSFIQESPYSSSLVEAKISGLREQAGGYHVHMVPVIREAQYPCEGGQVYGHYNPTGVDSSKKLRSGEGSLDQYEVGDLSGKYFPLNALTSLRMVTNDSTITLFGQNSVMGRSIVIHKAGDGSRWACSSIVWGYAPNEARQYSAIASFHHPEGFIYGYVRFRQVVYNDGSRSETSIEVNLRHADLNKLNDKISQGHRWEVFVNPSGHDQAVKSNRARCQSAGYRWDPYFIQLADEANQELYDQECGPDNPYRCDAGDLGSRLGRLELGGKRKVYSDANLPLGPPMDPESAVGRSLVIFEKEGSTDRYSCANLEADDDLIQWVTIEASSEFAPDAFVEKVREFLGAPEWYIETELSTAHPLHPGNCYQMILHFMGPKARELQKDFNSLISSGTINKPTITFHGHVPKAKKERFPFKSCGADQSRSTKVFGEPDSSVHSVSSPLLIFLALIFLFVNRR